jgi:hypothetical protein
VTNQIKTASQRVQEEWERSVERAEADKRTSLETDDDAFYAAAGLAIQSGARAGAWTDYCTLPVCV